MRNLQNNINFFNENGYVILKNALDKNQYEVSLALINKYIDEMRLSEDSLPFHFVSTSMFDRYPKLFSLIFKGSNILDTVTGIIGCNIKLSYADCIITKGPEIQKDNKDIMRYKTKSGVGWHRDGAFINYDIKDLVHPMLSLKVGIFLSDVSSTDRGNMYIIPRSHLYESSKSININDGIPLILEHLDVVLFDRRLYHTRSRIETPITRIAIFFEFSYRWLRRKSIFNNKYSDFSEYLNKDVYEQLFIDPEDPWENFWYEESLPLEKMYNK